MLDKKAMRRETEAVLEQMGVWLDPSRKVGSLPVGEKQIVEIARTIQQNSQIIIMDEPNSALNANESERLFELLRRLRDQGITIIYVSHRLEEVFSISGPDLGDPRWDVSGHLERFRRRRFRRSSR